MDALKLSEEFEQALATCPLLDVHSRLIGARLSARGVHDLLLEPALYAELCAASPNRLGGEVSQSSAEPEAVVRRLVPQLSRTRNTVAGWGLRLLLRELYGWSEPLTSVNWERLDALIGERAADPAWPKEVLRRAGIQRACTDRAGRGLGTADTVLQYSLEWGAFFKARANEYDTALYELERTWERLPEPPTAELRGLRPPTYKVLHSVHDVHEAVDHYVRNLPMAEIIAVTLRVGRFLPTQLPTATEFTSALERRANAGELESRIYSSYVAETLLEALESRTSDLAVVVHPTGTGGNSDPGSTTAMLLGWASRHPMLRIVCLPESAALNATLCVQARGLPNLAVGGIPWNAVSLDGIQRIFADRLDLLPIGRQCAFQSNAGCVEWAYARSVIARKQWANVLATRVLLGEFEFDEALAFAREALFESAQGLLRMTTQAEHLRG